MRQNLIILARAYCAHTGMTLGVLSRKTAGDPPYFARLIAREGTVSARKYDQLTAWFEKNWPKKAEIPDIWDANFSPPHSERSQYGKAKVGRHGAGKARD